MDVRIRAIDGDEWRLWRSLRMRAVEEAPDAFRSTLGQESAEADDWWIELIKKTADHPYDVLLVAEAAGDAVGMLFGRVNEGELLDVGSMWVEPEVRRNGIGRRLLANAVEWGVSVGAVRAELWVGKDNTAAQRLYEQAGFVPTGETEPLRAGSDLVVEKLVVDL
ncbi:MAG: GNAT family N-acetyltransferase [Acidimicrobiia bacterium]|nr:GNAT family N-acetyltransferase [Acidimicrobiia bacterium]